MRTSSEPSHPLRSLIDTALARAVIDADQAARLRAIAEELAAAPLESHPAPAIAGSTSGGGALVAGLREARRGLNGVTIAYGVGALLVLFALAWFLLDRWTTLGPVGVLVVSALYAGAFAVVGATLRRRGFEVAGGLGWMLAAGMTPVWGWAVLRLVGEWPSYFASGDALARFDPYMATRWLVLDLATIGVTLAIVRRVRFFALGLPLAAATVAALMHLGGALGDPRLAWFTGPYYGCVVATLVLAIAYAVERRQPLGEDYAFWFYLAGCLTLAIAYVQVWSSIGAWRHGVVLIAAAFATAAVYLRRRTLLVAAGLGAVGYLGYLAFDVFRRVVALPVALAALGLLVIVTTVWVQRRFPALVARVAPGQERRSLPAGWISVIGPVLIAGTALAFAGAEARERTEQREWQTEMYRKRMHNEAVRRHREGRPSEVRRAPIPLAR